MGAYFGGIFVLIGLMMVAHNLNNIANAIRDLNRR